MPLELAVPQPHLLGRGVWLAELQPDELDLFGPPLARGGEISVLLLPGLPPPDENSETLRFAPREVRLLNLGEGPTVVLVYGGRTGDEEDFDEIAVQHFGPRVQHDDEAFLKETELLPAPLRDVGKELLRRIRQEFGGFFQRTRAGRYVNRKNNFWTIKIQPRDRSYIITVRGYPFEFTGVTGVEVKDDMRGYSRFKLSAPDQLGAATEVIRRAALR